ncbi:MAG: beta-propeller domain-containing protein [Spongiibacteraceae bacterium]
MKHTVTRSHYTKIAIATTLACALSACGGSGSSGGDGSGEQETGLLRSVTSNEEFLSSFTASLTRTSSSPRTASNDQLATSAPEADGSDSAEDSSGGSSYTGTYTQEPNVDEYDVVKYDGDRNYLFIVPSLQVRCCFLFDDVAPAAAEDSFAPQPPNTTQAAIRILSTNPDNASATEVGEIPLAENEYIQGIYRRGDQLAALSTSNYYGSYGIAWSDVHSWQQQAVGIKIYDTSNISSPELSWNIAIEGGFVESRRIGNTIYLITRHTPYFKNLIYYPESGEQITRNAEILAAATTEQIIPQIVIKRQSDIDGDSSPLFDPLDCYITNEAQDSKDSAGFQTITSITAVPLDQPDNATTVCYNEDSNGVYVSDSAIYLQQSLYQGETSSTRIHKFSLQESGPSYRGSADVIGNLWSGGQRDFRISEDKGFLRLVTTEFTGDEEDRFDHRLFILQEAADSPDLELVSQLPDPNSNQPAELGKANEALYGVRFIGDRAYLVTFEQVDPLYAIDLSNPAAPFIAGELEIPGFSDFLHPIGDDLLLGLGQSALSNNQVKLELFDVSDISSPQSLGSSLIGPEGSWSWSEAQYDRHAFTYKEIINGADRIAVPAQTSWSDDEGNYFSENALHLFEIDDEVSPQNATLNETGKVLASPDPDVDYWYPNRHRSVIHDDAVFYILDEFVWSALWGDSDNQNGPQ